MISFGNTWDELLKDEFNKDYYLALREFLKNEYSTKVIYPHMNNIFQALKLTDYNDVKVVILGQDPYHGPNQAHGLAFSVTKDVAIPPSLLNIYKELNRSLGLNIPNNGDLTKWAKNGVLLLNSSLTVRKGQPNSHQNAGWEVFTDNIIKLLNKRQDPVIFMLWGSYAKKKAWYIDGSKHYILTSVHPSPLSASRGFIGCDHFKCANDILVKLGKLPIDWQIEDI